MIIDVRSRHLADQVLVLITADLLRRERVADRVSHPPRRGIASLSSADPHTLKLSQKILGPHDPVQITFIASKNEINHRHREADAGIRKDPRDQFHRSVVEASVVGRVEDRGDAGLLRLLDHPMRKHGPRRDLAISTLRQPPHRQHTIGDKAIDVLA